MWGEITMAHRVNVEILNTFLKSIRGNKKLIGGITVLLARYFKQTPAIVLKVTRTDEAKLCLKKYTL